jgi:membrane-associated HD superfamily phosphohydrolase
MTRTQSWLLVGAGVIAAVIFLVLTVYYGAEAAGHPHVKHMILFILLAIVGLLVAWFSYPKTAA